MLFSLQKTQVTKLVSTLLERKYGDLYMSKQHECPPDYCKIKLNFAKQPYFRITTFSIFHKFGLHCYVAVNCFMVINISI